MYDWKEYLTPFFKKFDKIKKQHHFRFDKNSPGSIFFKEYRESPEEEMKMLRSENIPQCMPPVITPDGLSHERKLYLYNEIRNFCKDEFKDLVCPKPE